MVAKEAGCQRPFYKHKYTPWMLMQNRYRWLSAGLQYLQCVSNGDTGVFHLAIDMMVKYFRIVGEYYDVPTSRVS